MTWGGLIKVRWFSDVLSIETLSLPKLTSRFGAKVPSVSEHGYHRDFGLMATTFSGGPKWLVTMAETAARGKGRDSTFYAFCSRSAIQTLMIDCLVTPSLFACLSKDSIIQTGKSTFTRRCWLADC